MMGRKFLQLFLCSVLMLFSVVAWSQVSGTVTDAESGETLIGANILIKGTSTGTVTDFDGNYTLDGVNVGDVLVFSYTGYAEQSIPYDGSNNTIDIVMSAGQELDEVVVIGYGTAKKSDVTGALVSVNEEDFNKGVLTSPDQLIQGRAAGVQMSANSGQPGGDATIRIRGISSLRGGNSPLFVVDGVPLSGISSKPGTGGPVGATQGSNPLNFLNPNDIANIQILKDASATAIYGSRGANGVILIQTKKGKSGDPTVTFNTSMGVSSIVKEYDVLDAESYRNALNDYGLTGGDFGASVNAFDEILQNGLTNNHAMTIGGGNSKGNYRVGLGYLNQEGIVRGTQFEKLTASFNGGYKFLESERLAVDFGMVVSSLQDDQTYINSNAGFEGNLIANALVWNPTSSFRNADGSLVGQPEFGASFINPLGILDGYDDGTNTTEFLASISPSYEIVDGLTYKLLYSYGKSVGSRRISVQPTVNITGIFNSGYAGIFDNTVITQNLTHTLNYNTDLSSKVSFGALIGYEYQNIDESGFGIRGSDFSARGFDDLTYVLQNSDQSSRKITSFANPIVELQSFFGRANINIDERYLITATVRRDGSSRFGENNRYGTFPSFALAWNLHNEDFFNSALFSSLKLRGGWGQVGNQEFPAGASRRQIRFDDDGQGSSSPDNVDNPNLKWETTTTANVGLDFSLWNYKVSGSVEYFNATTTDILFNLPAIPPAPPVSYWDNIDAEIMQSGVELSLDAHIVDNGKFAWTLGGNVSFIKSEFNNYNGPLIQTGQIFGQGVSDAFSQRLSNGREIYAWYLSEFTGINGDGQSEFANDGQARFTGTSPNPTTLLGLTTNLSMNKLALTLNFNGAFGHEIYNNTANTVLPINNLGSRNLDASFVGNDVLESLSNAIRVSDRFLEKGDYLKLANATLSYSVGDIGNSVKNVNVFVTGQNLFVLTSFSGFDPEVNTVNFNAQGIPSFGLEYTPYPSARTFIVGASFAF